MVVIKLCVCDGAFQKYIFCQPSFLPISVRDAFIKFFVLVGRLVARLSTTGPLCEATTTTRVSDKAAFLPLAAPTNVLPLSPISHANTVESNLTGDNNFTRHNKVNHEEKGGWGV